MKLLYAKEKQFNVLTTIIKCRRYPLVYLYEIEFFKIFLITLIILTLFSMNDIAPTYFIYGDLIVAEIKTIWKISKSLFKSIVFDMKYNHFLA